jgi:hypothetical protein
LAGSGQQVFARREAEMSRRKITPTTILTDSEVRKVVAGVRVYFAEWFDRVPQRPDIESSVRLGSLAKRCEARRREMRLSIAEAARLLRVPQYRLKAIEDATAGYIQGKILRAYVVHLGMSAWYKRWKRANPALADRLESDGAGEQRDAADGRAPGEIVAPARS